MHRGIDQLLDKGFPRPEGIGVVEIGLVRDEVLDKCGTSWPVIDPPAQLGVEHDGWVQQQSGYARVLQMAGIKGTLPRTS